MICYLHCETITVIFPACEILGTYFSTKVVQIEGDFNDSRLGFGGALYGLLMFNTVDDLSVRSLAFRALSYFLLKQQFHFPTCLFLGPNTAKFSSSTSVETKV